MAIARIESSSADAIDDFAAPVVAKLRLARTLELINAIASVKAPLRQALAGTALLLAVGADAVKGAAPC